MTMTRAEKAVEVAKDVLRVLRRKNHYEIDTGEMLTITNTQFNKNSVFTEKCTVCAWGAALASKYKLFDNKNIVNKYLEINSEEVKSYYSLDREEVRYLLRDVFTEKMLNNIEAAFVVNHHICDKPDKSRYGACVFGSKYDDKEKRLKAIMKNIIKNNGYFIVEPATEEEADEAC